MIDITTRQPCKSWQYQLENGNVNSKPCLSNAVRMLNRDKISLEDRVKLIGDVESLHTFAHIINRTRRRDIGNFTLREPETLKVSLHPSSKNVSIGKTAIYTTNCTLTIVRIDEKSANLISNILKRVLTTERVALQ